MEEKLLRSEFARRSIPHLEREHWLRSKIGSDEINPVGKAVVLIPRGYEAQQEELELPYEPLRWLTMNKLLARSLQVPGLPHRELPPLLEFEERCVISEASFYKDPKLYEEGNPEGLFVRLVLHKADDSSKFVVFDYHLGTACGEFVVPRQKYESAKQHHWRVGDSIRMWWHDPEQAQGGQWWYGTVKEMKHIRNRQRKKTTGGGANISMCPWNTLYVEWEGLDEGEEGKRTWVNFWEVPIPKDDPAGGSGMSERAESARNGQSDPNWSSMEGATAEGPGGPAGAADEADTADAQHNAEETTGNRRSKRKRQADVDVDVSLEDISQEVEDSEMSDAEEPRARGRARRDPPRESPVKAVTERGLKRDWNCSYCDVCLDGGELVACDGVCFRSYHVDCLAEDERPSDLDDPDEKWFCRDCGSNEALCTVCRETGTIGKDVFKCRLGGCGLHYHTACVKKLQEKMPMTVTWTKASPGSKNVGVPGNYRCPRHYCAVCHTSGDGCKMYHCFSCCTSYHAKCRPKDLETHYGKYISCADCVKKGLGPDDREPGPPKVTTTPAKAPAVAKGPSKGPGPKAGAPAAARSGAPAGAKELAKVGKGPKGAPKESAPSGKLKNAACLLNTNTDDNSSSMGSDLIPTVPISRSGRVIKKTVREDPFDNLNYTATGKPIGYSSKGRAKKPTASQTTGSQLEAPLFQRRSNLRDLGGGPSRGLMGGLERTESVSNVPAAARGVQNGTAAVASAAQNRAATANQSRLAQQTVAHTGQNGSPQLSGTLIHAHAQQAQRVQQGRNHREPFTGHRGAPSVAQLTYHVKTQAAQQEQAVSGAAQHSQQHTGRQTDRQGHAQQQRTVSHTSSVALGADAAFSRPYMHIVDKGLHKHLVGKDEFAFGNHREWDIDFLLPPGTPEQHSIIKFGENNRMLWMYVSQQAADSYPATLYRKGQVTTLATENVAAQQPVILEPQDELRIAGCVFRLYLA